MSALKDSNSTSFKDIVVISSESDSHDADSTSCNDTTVISNESDADDANSTSCNDIIVISGESDTDDATNNSDPLPTASTGSLQSTNPLNRRQLLFLYDCETTGLSHYYDRIIEIASVVIVPDNLTITQAEFSSLCHTSHRICSGGKLFLRL